MEKSQKNLKNDMLFLFVIELILLVFNFFKSGVIAAIINLIFAALMYVGYVKAKEGQKVAGIIGMVTGILMMLTILNYDLLDFLLGLLVLIHSLKYNKNFN